MSEPSLPESGPPPLPVMPAELPPGEVLGYAGPVGPVEPGRPRVWTVFVAFVTALAGAVGVSIVSVVIWMVAHRGATAGEGMHEVMEAALGSPMFVLGLMAGTIGATLAVTISAAKLSAVPTRERLGLEESRAGLAAVGVLMLGAAAVGFASGLVVGLFAREPQGSLKVLGETIGHLNGGEIILAYLLIALGAGISEELLFRGYIQTRLRQRIGVVWAVIVTALMFGLMHMDKVQGPAVVGLGLYLGWVRERTGSVRACIACHAFNNAAAITGALLSGGADATERGTPTQLIAGALVFGAVALGCGWGGSGLIRMRERRISAARGFPVLEG